jgi:hypothetical protein
MSIRTMPPFARGMLLGIAALLGVVIWRYHNLTVPPNWGASVAMCREADYLARTGFDYSSLRYNEPTHYEFGARVYMTSYMPTIIAWGMWYFQNPAAKLLWFHALGMFAGGTLFALFYWAARLRRAFRFLSGRTRPDHISCDRGTN